MDREGRVFAGILDNSDIHLRDLQSGRSLRVLNVRGVDVTATDMHAITYAVFTPDGKTLATAGADRVIRFWDVQSGQLFHTHEGHADAVVFISFTPDGKRMASASTDGTVRIWDVTFAAAE
jgi:WD40 repeat protein